MKHTKGRIFNIQKFSLHDGAGIRTGVFFQGCNMRCRWCANPESIERRPSFPGSEMKEYTVPDLIAVLIKDRPFYDASGGGVTLSGGEVLLQPDFAFALSDALCKEDINVALETSANTDPEIFIRFIHKMKAVYIDLKHYDTQAHLLGTGVDMARILINIRAALASGIHTVIRIPVIPGFNDSREDAQNFAALLKQFPAQEVQLLPFHQMGEHKYKKIGLPYALAGVPGLRDEDLEPFAEILHAAGVSAQIGG